MPAGRLHQRTGAAGGRTACRGRHSRCSPAGCFSSRCRQKCRVDFFPVKTGHWPGVEAQRPAGKNQIRRLQGAVCGNAVSSASCGLEVNQLRASPWETGSAAGRRRRYPRHDGGHRRLHGFLQIAAGERRAKFLFAFRAAHEHDARWRNSWRKSAPTASGPRRLRAAASLTGLSSQPLWVRAWVNGVSQAVWFIASFIGSPWRPAAVDSPSRKMVLKVSASVTLQAWPPRHFHELAAGDRRLQLPREQEAGTSRSSAALIISVGEAAHEKRTKTRCA